jgi:hypothetical protein
VLLRVDLALDFVAGTAAAAATAAVEMAWPMVTTMRTGLSPSLISSPERRACFCTFCPLTKVPFCDPRSMTWIWSAAVTEITACIRLTPSSSIFRCAEESFPILISSCIIFSVRTS